MRPGKTTLAGVAATLGLYRSGRAEALIPVWSMIAAPSAAIRDRAAAISTALGGPAIADVVAVDSTVGGGSLPGETLPSFGLAVHGRSAARMLAALRRGSPSIIGRIAGGRVILDLRTVNPRDDERLRDGIARAREAHG
jgi:L-seryl-tRNA(Ser) seleniumtransferase